MLSIFDLLHELIWKVIPEIICVIPFHVPAFAWTVSWLAWDVLLSHGTDLHLFSLLSLFWQKKKGLSQFQGLWVGKVTSQLAQPRLFIWNWLGQNVTINEREFCWCGGEKAEPALRQRNTDSVVIPATDSAIVLGLGLEALKFMVLSVHVVVLG